jgi:hypothetical protein
MKITIHILAAFFYFILGVTSCYAMNGTIQIKNCTGELLLLIDYVNAPSITINGKPRSVNINSYANVVIGASSFNSDGASFGIIKQSDESMLMQVAISYKVKDDVAIGPEALFVSLQNISPKINLFVREGKQSEGKYKIVNNDVLYLDILKSGHTSCDS